MSYDEARAKGCLAMWVLQELWVNGGIELRTHIVQNCFDLVMVEDRSPMIPSAVACISWENLSDELKGDLSSQFY